MNRFTSCACRAALMLVFGGPVAAQDAPDTPAHISVVDGAATLEREGQPDPAPLSMPLLAGDRLRTANGRIEVLFGDGATLHIDASSVVDFQSDDVIRLLEGRVRLTLPGPRREVSYRIDAPGGWVQIEEPGEYRVAVIRAGDAPEVELVVLRGVADILNEDGQTTLRAGERAFARAGIAPSLAYVYNSAAWDAFDRWSNDRRGARAGISAQYLPETVRPYSSTFDQYGSWRHEASYGYVWYPRVATEWRPYFDGRWASFPSFGWTWIGSTPWAWPTHHYGRWGFSAGSWFWIPGRTWGPAWVSWAAAPGYVSWCPLGWDNRPVVQFVGLGYYGSRHDPWRAWTIVPHQRFGVGYVNAAFVRGTRIDARTRGAFAIRQGAPEIRGYAVPRHAAPIYAAGSRRPGAPSYAAAPRAGGQRAEEMTGRAAASVPGGPRRGAGQDAAAVLRNRTPATAAPPTYSLPPGTPRGSTEPLGPPAAARSRDSRVPETTGVPVHRGAVPRSSADLQPGATELRRLEVPGYRRAPSTTQATQSSGSPAPLPRSVLRRAPAGQREDFRSITPMDRGGRVGPERQSGARYQAVPRSSTETAQPNYRAYPGIERRGPSNAPVTVVPRHAPEAPQPPAYRSYGGVERRGSPAGPPPSAAPPRESGPPPSATPPRGEPPARSRPSGQPQPDRGGAVRRSGRG